MKLIKASDIEFLRLQETTKAVRSEASRQPLTTEGVLVWLRTDKPIRTDPRAAWQSLFKEAK